MKKESALDKVLPYFVSSHIREYAHEQMVKLRNPKEMDNKPAFVSLPRAKKNKQQTRSTEILEEEPQQKRVQISTEVNNSVRLVIEKLDPVAMEGWAAVVMCDVSGYSSLASFLSDRGAEGAEILGQIMKEYLDKIILIIAQHGGDIVKFVGDAVIFYWKYKEPTVEWYRWAELNSDNVEKAKLQHRGRPVLRATQCCLDLLEKLGKYKVKIPGTKEKKIQQNGFDEKPPDDERELKIHLGIGAGKIFDVHVGGPPGRWEHFVVGDAMEQLAVVLDLAKPGQLALSKRAFESFKHCVNVESVVLDSYDTKKFYIVNSFEKSAIQLCLPDEEVKVEQKHHDLMDLYKLYINESALFKLQTDLRTTTQVEVTQLMNMSELRQVTTVFIKIGSLSFAQVEYVEDAIKEQEEYIELKRQKLNDGGEEEQQSFLESVQALESLKHDFKRELQQALSRCQLVMTTVQTYLKKHDGILRQFHVDDKGAVVLAFFGLPPKAHKNDAPLGIEATLSICDDLKKTFDSFSIGVTTGTAYIGGVGASSRFEYALIGDSINMAARLMGLPAAKKSVVCDERTRNLSQSLFDIKFLGKATVKGKAFPIEIYQPITKRIQEKSLGQGNQIKMIGRENECKLAKLALETHLEAISNSNPSINLLIVEGESGQGLTTFGMFLKALGEGNSFLVCTGNCMENEKTTPFYALRGIVRSALAYLESSGGPVKSSVELYKPGSISMLATSIYNSRCSLSRRPAVTEEHFPRVKMFTAESEFEICAATVLRKLDLDYSVHELLSLIFPDEYKRSISSTDSRLYYAKMNELTVFIAKSLNLLTNSSKIMVILPDFHFIDRISFDLLKSLIGMCPRTFFVLLTQPLRRTTQTIPAKSSNIMITSLGENEIEALILSRWNQYTDGDMVTPIQKVDPPIVTKIFQISHGSPLFACSLVATLMEKKLYNITQDGLLVLNSTNDFDKIAPGSDLHAIIVSQFDRLDPSFQCFLKIASILGQTFSLGDVIQAYGAENSKILSATQATNKEVFLENLDNLDKFSFLILPEYNFCSIQEVLVGFKNAIIRESIYNTMLVSQRQQLHLNFAISYEDRFKSQNDKQLVLKILEHYQKSDGPFDKKLEYLVEACHLYYSCFSMHETITHYDLLFDLLRKKFPEWMASNAATAKISKFSILDRAKWYTELGEAYFATDKLSEAESCLRKALSDLNYSLPSSNSVFLKTKCFLLKLQLKPKLKNPAPGKNMSTLISTRSVLMSIIELDIFGNSSLLWRYVVWKLQTLTNKLPKDSMAVSILALTGYSLFITGNQDLSRKFLVSSQSILIEDALPDSIDTALIYSCIAAVDFLKGGFENSQTFSSKVLLFSNLKLSLGLMMSYQSLIIIKILACDFSAALSLASELEHRSSSAGHRGLCFAMASTFFVKVSLTDASHATLCDFQNQLLNLASKSPADRDSLMYMFFVDIIKLQIDPEKYHEECVSRIQLHLKHIELFHWPCFIGYLSLCLFYFKQLKAKSNLSFIPSLMESTIKSLRAFSTCASFKPMNALLTGMLHWTKNNFQKAKMSWNCDMPPLFQRYIFAKLPDALK